MHDTSLLNAKLFFETYESSIRSGSALVKVIEIGSQDVNGTIRSVCPTDFEYIGLDFQKAKGVDVVLTDPCQLPFDSDSVDVVVSNSCFEHSEFFWVLFLEVLRVLKPTGLFYLNAPSNGAYHRYPVDCWRFYPDSGRALVAWAKRNHADPILLESYTSYKVADIWNDFVAVFLKDSRFNPCIRKELLKGFRILTTVGPLKILSCIIRNFLQKIKDARSLLPSFNPLIYLACQK